MAISNNKNLYFDRVTRTRQAQTINALAHATYHSNGNKEEIIRNLGVYLDKLRESGKGNYGNDDGKIKKQFSRIYTPGLEFGIWKIVTRKEMILTNLAIDMVRQEITPEIYISKVLLNYYQIINDDIVNPLYSTLLYMNRLGKKTLTKEDINSIKEFNLYIGENDNRNAWYHLLSYTVFFNKSENEDELLWNNKFTINKVIHKCNTELFKLDKDYVVEKYSNQELYAEFITK